MMSRILSQQLLYVLLTLVACMVMVLCVPLQDKFKASNDLLSRKARNLHQFGNMVNCMTNRSRFDYSDYGCWCGMGGSGETVDEVDKCCKIHDKCFVSLMYTKCYFPFHVYTVVYNYQGCRQCDPISSYSSWEDKVDVECKKGVCDCDSAAALCFSQAVYNSSYVNYDTSKC